ncbi:YdiU family protein [Stappia sp. GBMRC 2046]|uniref:Protein nucleotidyltransferase YdiU n=1 Tax=Stappia sediminis TaxID=2692190 RepID=A0A7X3LW97_9HYPH|nr:YdiU family protein [Stappia sediminis]MXN66296.1 YdiU family protein [Stappia sediminis]
MNAPHPQAETIFPFDHSYAGLPERFYARLSPTAVTEPQLIRLNDSLARELGLDPAVLKSPAGVEMLAGNRVAEGSTPIAMAYAGHQFGTFVPQLGDGRAILLGEIVAADGARYDIQLKGSGRTPFSRGGDGRAWIGPVLREYIVSEAMHALGLPTTRALSAVKTGDRIMRETLLPGAILTRVAKSHIRVGTFEYFAARRDEEALRALADYAIARHYPHAKDAANPYRAFLDAVVEAQARLVARWMHVGFIHGVMNTDNTSISGETIDYGPCAFMDTYHPGKVFSSIDQMGRYAYANQPRIAYWNLSRLAQAMLPILGKNEEEAVATAQEAIDAFPDIYETAWLEGMRAKLGLSTAREEDRQLAYDLFEAMANAETDFTLTFRALSSLGAGDGTADDALRDLPGQKSALDEWIARWRARLGHESAGEDERKALMRSVNPAFIPRNHRVEEAIAAAMSDDYGPFERLLAVLSDPYSDQPENAEYASPPKPEEVVHRTFCGT